jgi:predicted nucleic acid-binding protein
VNGVVADTSVWVEFLRGGHEPTLEEALAQRAVVLPPIVVAELISGASRARDRAAVGDLIGELPVHDTPLTHWIRVGTLRRDLRRRGISVSTPDAHVAQCALERNATLLTLDTIFLRIAETTSLRVRGR